MARAEDVAKYIIDIFTIKADHGFDDGMTNLRLQKLLYLAQGYSLATYDKPLFPEAIEAWKYGPVVPTVYSKYNKFNRGVIHDDPPDQGALTDEEAELILDVLSVFGKYSTGYLVDLSHRPDAPWAQVYNESNRKLIDNTVIEEYFKKQKKLVSADVQIAERVKNEADPKRGKSGYILLPAEEYEDWEEYAGA